MVRLNELLCFHKAGANAVHTSEGKGMGFDNDLELDNTNCLMDTRDSSRKSEGNVPQLIP